MRSITLTPHLSPLLPNYYEFRTYDFCRAVFTYYSTLLQIPKRPWPSLNNDIIADGMPGVNEATE